MRRMHFPKPLSRFASTSLALALALAPPLAGCGDGTDLDNDDAARLAYLGLDQSVDRALKLGFQGFNAASNANIPTQSEAGAAQGKMDVGGKVDQGASNNKEMDLTVTLTGYSDGPLTTADAEEIEIVYDTEGPAILDLSLKGLPNATMTGSLTGTYFMSGGLEGPVTLNLSIAGMTEDAGGVIQRKPGTTRISGTATSDFGVFDVDVTR